MKSIWVNFKKVGNLPHSCPRSGATGGSGCVPRRGAVSLSAAQQKILETPIVEVGGFAGQRLGAKNRSLMPLIARRMNYDARRAWVGDFKKGVVSPKTVLLGTQPSSTKTQTRHVQAVTRAFSIARVSLSREQHSQTLDQAKSASCCLRKGVGGGFMGSRPARWIRHRELCTHANSQARQCRTALALICLEGLRPGKLLGEGSRRCRRNE